LTGVPAAGDGEPAGAADGAADAATDGAEDGAAGDGVAEPPQAATTIAAAAISDPKRVRIVE